MTEEKQKNNMATSEKGTDSTDTSCGIGNFYPKRLQKCANIYCFSVIYILICLTRGIFGGYTGGVITTVEKRFRLSSQSMGVIFAMNDVGHVMFVLFLSHFGGKGRVPLILGVSMLLQGISIFSFALPHFIFGSGIDENFVHVPNSSETSQQFYLCNVQDNLDTAPACNNALDDENQTSFALLIILNIVFGMSGSAIYILGMTYVDNNVEKSKVPLLLGKRSSI